MLPKTLSAFLWHFLRPYFKTFCGMIFSVFLMAILTSLTPYLLKLIIDGVAKEYVSAQDLFSAVLWPAVSFVLLYQAMDLGWALYDYFRLKTLPKVREDIINSMYTYLQGHAFGFFQKNLSGSLSNKVADMSRGAESVLAQLVEPIISQVAALSVAIISMYLVHPLSSAILLLWSFVFLGIVLLFYRKTLFLSESFSESNSHCMGKLLDTITNIVSVKLFARGRYESEYLAKYARESRIKDQTLQWHMFKIKILQGLSVTILFGCMVGFLIYARSHNLVTVGDFAFVLTLSMTVMQGLWYLASHLLTFSQELGVCKQALSIINVSHELVDAPGSKRLEIAQGGITFDNVSFQYERGKNVFRDTSLAIPGGQKVGLVGFSGSGKTTFASLVLRFYNIASGKILIDGQNIAEVTQDSLHNEISMIPQDPMLFHRSLMENIRYGRLEASDEEVIEAAKRAHCHEFIELFPEGYHTVVGERGTKLSGGQRQRIAIARAILKDAPILILDEATSALDSVTEQKIRDSLSYLMEKRTAIVIAHRLSTLTDMDRILVFMGGSIVEDGSHEALIQLDGHYAKLWEMQAGGLLPEWAMDEDENYYEDEEEVVS